MMKTHFLVSVLLLAASAASAATSTVNPFSDSFVTTGPSGNLSANNYGKAGALAVAAPGLPKGEFQSVLQFDLSSARNSFNTQYGADLWSVQSVTLQLTATPSNNAIFNGVSAGQFKISLLQNNSWTEGNGSPSSPGATGINYNSLIGSLINNTTDQDLGTFSFAGNTSGANIYTLSLSPGLISDLMAGSDLSLRLYAADSSINYIFNSEDFSTAGNHPLLTISVIPEPGTLALSGLGFALLASWPFRRDHGRLNR